MSLYPSCHCLAFSEMGRPQRLGRARRPANVNICLIRTSGISFRIYGEHLFSSFLEDNIIYVMNAFVSWSGGKDCMFALHHFLQKKTHNVACLVNMCEENCDYSRSHGLRKGLIEAQASCMNIPLIQKSIDDKGYEACFKGVIQELKKKNVDAGVFGDIYLQEHRTWIERVCNEMEIQAVFPIWGYDTKRLLCDFISEGFKALTVSVRCDMLSQDWLGRDLNQHFFEEISSIEGVDPCAENGEYHTFVYDGPVFAKPVDYTKGAISIRDKHYFLELNCL